VTTFSQAFRFFREKYKISCYIFNCGEKYPTVDEDYDAYYYVIGEENGYIVSTYEEAELECLKILIQIAKKGNK